MEAQEIFDKVAAHLEQQRSTSIEEGGTCMYRGAVGKMCAIGCLIPDDKYNRQMEYQGVTGPDVKPVLEELGLYEHKKLLDDLQILHDKRDVQDWPDHLANIARIFELKEYTRVWS